MPGSNCLAAAFKLDPSKSEMASGVMFRSLFFFYMVFSLCSICGDGGGA